VRISTDPGCDTGRTFTVSCGAKSFAPGFLQPSTTYYWQATWAEDFTGCSSGSGGRSAIFSFTTAPPIAVNRLTWGRVKSRYRE